ncbi:hypothetical protein [Oryzomicrobium sp.]|uniref:hypothetical protein n=1 Tax=Oryzomicrobium sp. TaxID=1911578 RepID=UPI002FE01180
MSTVTLAPYVSAILRRTGPHAVREAAVERSAWQDQGVEVRREVTTYRFADGAVIRRTVEEDDFPDGLACAECWITYEVLDHGAAGAPIRPARQVFENACRESFWLAYHSADPASA